MSPDSNGHYWNSVHSAVYHADMVDISNNTTTVDLGFDAAPGTDFFNGPSGTNENPALSEYDATALGDLGVDEAVYDYYVSSRFQVQGLDTGRTYSLTFFGSHKFSADDATVYSVYSNTNYTQVVASVSLNVQTPGSAWLHNSNTVAVISNLVPQTGNILYVGFEGSTGDSGYLNAMKIESAPQSGPPSLEAYVNPMNGNVPVPRETRVDADETRKLAFPSARGFGRFADPDIGPGQDFDAIKVTNLLDSGPGSYRDAIMSTNGPRVVIFTVSGTIDLTETVLMREPQDNVYVAGQTSPGGIQLKCSGNNEKAPLRAVRTRDIIARFLKLRPGLDHALSSDVDSLAMNDVENSIFDHLSLQWSTDEAAHITSKGDGVTLQWSLQSEPLRCGPCRSDNHSQHDYGVFSDVNKNLTLYKNFFMGGRWRNPNVQATNALEMINNVGYNYGEYAAQFYVNATRGNLIANIIGNWYSKGPRTAGDPHMLFASYEGSSSHGFEFYVDGNIGMRDTSGVCNINFLAPHLTSPVMEQNGTLLTPDGQTGIVFAVARADGLSIPAEDIVSADQAMKDVIVGAGAMQDMFSTPRRDLVDARSMGQFQNCDDTGYTPQPDPLDAIPAPGYPDLTTNTTWSWTTNDVDDDGMLDAWETLYADLSLVPNGDPDGDGWSNMEEFLNYMAGEHIQWTGTGDPVLVPPVYCGYPVGVQPTADMDSDGLPDGWEWFHFGQTDHPNGEPHIDWDGDGHSNLQELYAGTNPTNASSIFMIKEVSPSGDTYEVTWLSASGKTYAIYRTDDLVSGWTNAASTNHISASPSGTNTWFDTQAPTHGASYRVRVE
ncbi:MAG: hypothetical protein KJ626_14355 [Verrucomicrobia bacterium]|nr:hypothetical protein [Verrucomicrobiota bacterium]